MCSKPQPWFSGKNANQILSNLHQKHLVLPDSFPPCIPCITASFLKWVFQGPWAEIKSWTLFGKRWVVTGPSFVTAPDSLALEDSELWFAAEMTFSESVIFKFVLRSTFHSYIARGWPYNCLSRLPCQLPPVQDWGWEERRVSMEAAPLLWFWPCSWTVDTASCPWSSKPRDCKSSLLLLISLWCHHPLSGFLVFQVLI